MGRISDLFNEQPWAKRLGRRGPNFKIMCEHTDLPAASTIVETGTAWDQDNFEGQGQSTLIWDWLARASTADIDVISIDIRPEGIETAEKQTKHVCYRCGDSVKVLHELEHFKPIRLLYLDSFDWTPQLNLESAAHHLMELTSIWSSLPPGCMVVVDDRHGDFQGKHWMVEAYMAKLGIEPVFKNHQIGWIKP